MPKSAVSKSAEVEQMLTPYEFGEVTNTNERLARRLIAERRIRFVRVGRYVRIPQSAVAEFLADGTVERVRSGEAGAVARCRGRLAGDATMTAFVAHAVALAANGWPVFPLAPRSKVPLVAGGHGHLDGSTDPAQAERTWTRHPHANIGARVPNTLVCVDLDPRNGAVETLTALVGTYGLLPATLLSLTGSGGAHLFYARPAGELTQRSNLLGAGIDVKVGGRGYLVLPPSIHPNGRRYCWAADPTEVAPMPAWMVQKLRPPQARPKRKALSLTLEGDSFDAIAAAFNARARWGDILEPHGWTHWRTRGENQHWTRPGESGRTSATINEDGEGVLYVFSTAAGLDDSRAYSKFGAFTILNHGGDYAAAVAALKESSCPA